MMIAAVDQYDIDISVPQRPCRGDPGKASPDDDDALALSAAHLIDVAAQVEIGAALD